MRTPGFWSDRNLLSTLLTPLGWVYHLATQINMAKHSPSKVNVPVICVGNLTAGGTGKTPTAVSLAKLLQQQNRQPFFLSRGYGGALHNIVVDPTYHSPQQVGDEPLLLSRQAPVVVNPNRYQGALTAIANGADTLIMDDGFQNPKLYKDLSFLVFDGGFGYGNGLCVPAGPLRESLHSGLKRANAIIVIGDDKHNLSKQFNLPVFRGKIIPVAPEGMKRRVIAFAGIGRPDKFYQSLRELDFEILETMDFPDHHFYKDKELDNLIKMAQENTSDLITTAKDLVKIPAQLRAQFKVLEIEIEWENPGALTGFILKSIA